MDVLAALGAFDQRLYLAITSSRNAITASLAVALAAANVYGIVWWLWGLAAARRRGVGRRGLAILVTLWIGLVGAWTTADLLKLVVQRPRPFLAIPGAAEPLFFRPDNFSFPSGDTAVAFGAAVALGHALPRFRWPALILAAGIGLARVAVGVHYPLDVVGGALVGIAWGIAAPSIVAKLSRRIAWRIFVVPHTHWDREWSERFEGYRARLVPMVSKLLDILERDPEFRSFTFDGQTIPIEDHLAVRPADRPRVERLVRSDRLLVGPWYVLADHLLPSGESLVRNFQEGLRVAQELGRAMRVCYVADPFGHPAQMPQIARGFGYGSYIFARGVGDEGEELGSEFQWEAPSGDRVLASHQVAHYSNAIGLVGEGDEDPAALRRRVRRILPRLMRVTARYASGSSLLFMVGDDHVEPSPRLPEAVAAIRAAQPRSDARIASLEEFIATLPKPSGVHAGEMIAGKYRPILRGVNSTRAWIKLENARDERLLLWGEALDALAGGAARDRLRSLWRTLLENHPHDSICGCSIDPVHDIDMRARFDRVRDEGGALAAELEARLAGDGAAVVAWNPLPWERECVLPQGGVPRLVRVVALGVAPPVPVTTEGVRSPEDGVLENALLRVEVADDGSFAIVDRRSGHRWERQNAFVDDGDRGDEYTFSYAGPTVTTADVGGARTTSVEGHRGMVTVECVLRLPLALREDRFARVPETVACPLRVDVTLDAESDRVDVEVTVDNAARDHRLRVEFDTGTRTLTHVAGAAFALLERPNRVSPRPGWIEPPTAERCVHDVVAVRGPSGGLAVGVDGIREYAVLKDGATISITLLRCVGWLSRGDLRERRGHAGPALETPSAQCPGRATFRYCLVPLDGAGGVAEAMPSVREFLSPVRIARGDGAPLSFLTMEPSDPGVVLSALRAGPDGALVVRLVQAGAHLAEARLRFARPVVDSRPVDLREGVPDLGNTGFDVMRTAAPLELRPDGSAIARLAPYEIGTWVVTLAS